ncbi:hypothetical protein [Mesobacillus zeae]|uniref:hypothetical protein n=1 Tax=Mesobacillus zeae TaxID=1917180 RepID=UPI00300B0907
MESRKAPCTAVFSVKRRKATSGASLDDILTKLVDIELSLIEILLQLVDKCPQLVDISVAGLLISPVLAQTAASAPKKQIPQPHIGRISTSTATDWASNIKNCHFL